MLVELDEKYGHNHYNVPFLANFTCIASKREGKQIQDGGHSCSNVLTYLQLILQMHPLS